MTDTQTPKRGRGRPAIGDRIEIRLTPAQLEQLDHEAHELGWKRAELIRWIVGDRYGE